MRHAWMTAILLLVTLGSANSTRAQEPALKIPPELILERFQVNTGGDALLVPVKIAGKERLFLVDTGSTITVIDESVPVGAFLGVVPAKTPQGEAKVKLHSPPPASLASLPLRLDVVACTDLTTIRDACGHPIEGILGMDFLSQFVVHIDFDRGELLLLKSVPKDAGEVFSLHSSPRDILEIEAWTSRAQKLRLTVDTGYVALESGMIQSTASKLLVRNGDFQEIGSRSGATLSGTHEYPLLQGQRMTLGKFSIERPIFAESPGESRLGLGFWSRFVVTFDFPGNKVSLKKGQGFDRPDLYNRTGLRFVKRDGFVLIDQVDLFSPASSAGIRTGDILLSLGTLQTHDTSLLELRKRLCQPGPLACSVRRGTQERRITINVPR